MKMKKLALFCLSGLTAMAVLTGCSGSTTEDGKENLGQVTLAEYKGVKVNVPLPSVSDEEVESRIQSDLAAHPKEVEVDREAKEGDVVNIDYKGTQDGVEFAGGSAQDQDLELGSGKMIDGFEDGLIGAKKGDTKELNLTFPEDYSEASLAGQAAVFEVTVNAVKEKQDAVLDDAFVQENTDYATVAEYRQGIYDELMDSKQADAELQMQQDALQTVIDGSTFKLNRNALSRRYNASVKQYREQAKMYGMTFSTYARNMGQTEASLKQSIYASVTEDAKSQLVIDTIAVQENITLEDADREELAARNGQTAEQMVEAYGQETADELALNYKVMKFLADNAVNEAASGETAADSATPSEAAK